MPLFNKSTHSMIVLAAAVLAAIVGAVLLRQQVTAHSVQTSTDVTIATSGPGRVFADGVAVYAGVVQLPLGETTFTLVPSNGWRVNKVIWRYSADDPWSKVYGQSEIKITVAPGLDIGIVFEEKEVECVISDDYDDDHLYFTLLGKGEVRFLDIVVNEDNSRLEYHCTPVDQGILFEAVPDDGWRLDRIMWEYNHMEGAPGWTGETTASSIELPYSPHIIVYFEQTSADVKIAISGDGTIFADGVEVQSGTAMLPLGETTFTLVPANGWQVDKIIWRYRENDPWTKAYGISEVKLNVAPGLDIGVVFEKAAPQSTPTPTYTSTTTPTQTNSPADTNTPTPTPTSTPTSTSTPTPTPITASPLSLPTPTPNIIRIPLIQR